MRRYLGASFFHDTESKPKSAGETKGKAGEGQEGRRGLTLPVSRR